MLEWEMTGGGGVGDNAEMGKRRRERGYWERVSMLEWGGRMKGERGNMLE